MIKRNVKYVDFDGNEVEEEYYFNLSKMELMDLETSKDGGFGAYIDEISKSENVKDAFNIFKEVVLMSVGKRSEDGKRFIKNDEIRDDFKYSPAFDEVVFSIMQSETEAAEFVNGLLPADLAKEVEKQNKKALKSSK